MSSAISLKDVSLKFKLYEDKGSTLKEILVNKMLKRKVGGTKEFWALKNININFKAGDRVGIIGNNGAGKSTLLKLFSQIYAPTCGTIQITGKVAPLIELGAGFNPELSGYENIFLNGAIMGVPKKLMRKHLQSIIDFSELQEFMQLPVKYYSSGMYMRLAFSIATEVIPDILIIDEIFAGGDINFIKKANKRMDDLISGSQIVIMVSHSMDLIERNCNKVILIDKGEIVAEGEPTEVIELYRSQTS